MVEITVENRFLFGLKIGSDYFSPTPFFRSPKLLILHQAGPVAMTITLSAEFQPSL